MADIYLATLLHRLYFAGQVKRFFGDGKRPYLAAYYVQKRKSFIAACGKANNLFLGSMLPMMRHKMKKVFPRMVGFSLVAGAVGFALYIKYNGFPSWWPDNYKFNF